MRQALLKKYDNTCQSCGITGVPLDLIHIIPVSEGGSHEIDNLTILCRKCSWLFTSFQPREVEFNIFLRDILTASPDFSNVVVERALGEQSHVRADLTTTRRLNGRNQSLLIESKSRPSFRQWQIERVIAQINLYRSIESFDAVAFAFPGRISEDDKVVLEAANIEVWDLDYVVTTFLQEIKSLPLSGFKQLYSLVAHSLIRLSDTLLKRLHDCTPGRENWFEYQRIIKDVFQFLFTPPLEDPIWESSDSLRINRRDIIFPNNTPEGFWKFLRESYSAYFIIIDTKNYKNQITKSQVLQIANYLKPHGAGMFAIIACRKGGNTACMTTLREQWAAYGKLIILLTDRDIEEMLLADGAHGKPEEVIGQIIQEFRLSM